jgi:signal transduction histidine kinase
MFSIPADLISPRRLFRALLVYRWLSLIPPLAAAALSGEQALLLAVLLAGAATAFVSLTAVWLNRALRNWPILLGLDLWLMAMLAGLTGGWDSPFFLHALNPLLIAAFFFQMRGALIAATILVPLYLIAPLLVNGQAPALGDDWSRATGAIVGFYLIGGAVGYASGVADRLRRAQDDLAQTHRDLKVIHELTVSLQQATHVEEVLDRALAAITSELNFPKAMIGLINAEATAVSRWRDDDGRFRHAPPRPLAPGAGVAGNALADNRAISFAPGGDTAVSQLCAHFQFRHPHLFPLRLRQNPIGVLLVDVPPTLERSARLSSLTAVANQAAVAIGATLLCIDRASQLAVQEERLRIAQDLHDNVSQSLFGIVFTLDGCRKLLPGDPETALAELAQAQETAEAVRREIRHSIMDIWPTTLTADRFTADLRAYAATIGQADEVEFTFDVQGAFGALSPAARRGLYRIAQEAIANIIRHAAATEARVCVDVADGRARLVVRDDGRGFEPDTALAEVSSRDRFGLRGVQERARALDGSCHIFSKPGAGASLVVDIPVRGRSSQNSEFGIRNSE